VAVCCCITLIWSDTHTRSLLFLLVSSRLLFFISFPQEGKTPLHKAAEDNHSEVMQILVTAGAVVDARDKVRCAHVSARFSALS
jgi:hypothetical protein